MTTATLYTVAERAVTNGQCLADVLDALRPGMSLADAKLESQVDQAPQGAGKDGER